MKWVTREQVRVGRMGCSWLIRRFIDPEAEIIFVPRERVLPAAEELGATAFHEAGTGLGKSGDKSSFEVMLEAYNLTGDPALVLLGKIVGTADVPTSPWQQPEGPGMKALTEGILAAYPTDDERIDAARGAFDAFYAYCQEMQKRKMPDGMFKH